MGKSTRLVLVKGTKRRGSGGQLLFVFVGKIGSIGGQRTGNEERLAHKKKNTTGTQSGKKVGGLGGKTQLWWVGRRRH